MSSDPSRRAPEASHVPDAVGPGRETSCSMVLSAEEWQLLAVTAAIASPGMPIDDWAREVLLREARRLLAATTKHA